MYRQIYTGFNCTPMQKFHPTEQNQAILLMYAGLIDHKLMLSLLPNVLLQARQICKMQAVSGLQEYYHLVDQLAGLQMKLQYCIMDL